MTKKNGQILVIVLATLGVVLFTVLAVVAGAQVYFQNSYYSVQAEKATALAEAGVDKAVASINKAPSSYNGEQETFLDPGSYSISVTNKDSATLLIKSTGYIPNKTNPKVKRSISIQVSKGSGISFVYGMLVGEGGISIGNGSTINGSIYSNGNISGGNNVIITGDAYVAGGTQPAADQQSDCSGVNCQSYIFGKKVGNEDRQYVAQSFKPSSTAAINKVTLKLKKIGLPNNPTIRIMADNNGSPNKNAVLATGTLLANLVTDQYGFIDVTLSSNPTLAVDTTYWIMVAASELNNSNYWSWLEDLAQSYNRGSSAWSSNWQSGNPSWNSIQADLEFKTWMGGVATSINFNNGSRIKGNVHAHAIAGSIYTIEKDAYYSETIDSSITVQGVKYSGSLDPAPIAMPISQANISDWQADAQEYGTYTGDINGCPSTLGPGKFVGNITTSNTCTITVTTPIWITGEGKGNLTFGNSTTFRMDPALGSISGVIIVDGVTTFQNTDDLLGTGSTGSYLTLLSTYNSQTLGGSAINTGNSSITGILYAPFGIITLANNANFKEAVGWQINMGTGTVLTYDSGLISTFFSAGPSGSFSIVKGTYQVK